MIKHLAFVLSLLVFVCFTSRARADSKRGVIELVTDTNEAPSMVCLVLRKSDVPDFTTLGNFHRRFEDEKATRISQSATWGSGRTKHDDPGDDRTASGEPSVKIQQALVHLDRLTTEMVNSCREHWKRGGAHRCAPTAPSPKRFGAESIVTCEEADTTSDRIVFVNVDFRAASGSSESRKVSSVQFKNSVITFDVNEEFAFFTAAVAGGYYSDVGRDAVSSRGDKEGGRTQLKATPRCQRRTITPPANWTEATRVLSCRDGKVFCEATVDPNASVSLWPKSASVWVPTATVNEPTSVRAHLESRIFASQPSPTCADEPDAAAQWNTEAPPAEIKLGLRRVSFEWSPSCLYPARDEIAKPGGRQFCPDVELAQTIDAKCTKRNQMNGTCEYTCTSESEIPLPASLLFKVKGGSPDREDRWKDSLVRREKQTLREYLAPSDRYLDVRIDRWKGEEKRQYQTADRISHVEVDIAGGAHHVIGPHDESLPAPGLECKTGIRYLVHGDRSFNDQTIRTENALFHLPDPDRTVRNILLTAEIGAGLGDSRFAYGLGDAEVESTRWMFGSVFAGFVHRPPSSSWAWSARIGYIISERDYFALTRPGLEATRERVAFSRFPVDIGGIKYLVPAVAIGLGISPMLETTLRGSDSYRAGELSPGIGAYAEVRVEVFRNTWLVYQPRVFATDPLYLHQFDEATGSTHRTMGNVFSFSLLAASIRGEWGFARVLLD